LIEWFLKGSDMTKTFLSSIFALGLMTIVASAQTLVEVDTDRGKVMAAAKSGMTLYTFRKDAAGQSTCYDDCAVNWPPFTASAEAKADGALGVIERKDGVRQWALNGKPLYFWQGDSEKGDATGDGVGGVWDVVRP
jgi:predicted lipoprotein with Yx(FWY)xxD motif